LQVSVLGDPRLSSFQRILFGRGKPRLQHNGYGRIRKLPRVNEKQILSSGIPRDSKKRMFWNPTSDTLSASLESVQGIWDVLQE
jgi:hypothetical protein